MAGQVFAVASGKGGVGKTTTVVNLGVVLRRADHTVALVDADLGMANLASLLGVSSSGTLHDVLAGRSSLDDALVEEAPGFAVLVGSGTLTDYPEADPEQLGDVLETLADSYDFVLVDTGAGMSHEDVLPLGLADRVILVASPDPAAIGDTRKTAELAGLAAGDIAGVVVTKADSSTDATHVASQVGVDLLGVIPFDPTVRESTAAGRPLEAVDPDTPAATAYRELANALADGATDPLSRPARGEEAPTPGGPAESPATDSDTGDDQPPGPDDAESEAAADADEPATAPADEAEAGEPPEPAAEDPEEPDEAAKDEAETDETAEPERPSESEEEAIDDEERAESTPSGTPDESAGEVADDDGPDEPGESEADAASADEAEEAGEEDDAEEEDPLAEFEDDEPERKRGFLARLSRLFR